MELPGPPSPKNPACDFRRTGLKPRKSTIKFQFHISAIRRVLSIWTANQLRMFQFHIGAIRRSEFKQNGNPVLLFQFHIGAIRRKVVSVVQNAIKRFQFHIGAIRRSRIQGHNHTAETLQFHIGAIRSRESNMIATPKASFNSILVQLEDLKAQGQGICCIVSIPYWCN